MKANKALKRLTRIETWMSDVRERYSASAPIRVLLQDAKAAVTRAREAVSLQASSGTAKNPPVKHAERASKAKPEFSKPKRKLGTAGKAAIVKLLKKKRWATKEAGAAGSRVSKTTAAKKAPVEKAATAKTSAKKKSAPKKTAVKVAAKPREQAITKSANVPAQAVAQALL